MVLLQAPHDYGALLDRRPADCPAEWLPLEGRVTRIRYDAARHAARMARQAALTARGFTIVRVC